MRKKLTLLLFFYCICFYSQTIDHIQFDYDSAGNQTRRYAIDILENRNTNVKDTKDISKTDLKTSDLYNDIKYYPNPVQQELFVEWKNTEESYVEKIEVHSMSGQLMQTYKNLSKQQTISVSFQDYPNGFYNLILVYSNSEKKSLRIIKK